MVSEPAEPTTRQQLIEKTATGICDAYEAYAPVPAVLWSEAHNIARALAEAGLLADPEQHAELEQLRESKRISLEINQGWVAYRERTKVRRREFLDQIATLMRERDERQARLDAIERWLRPEVVVGWIQPRGYRERYLAEDVIRGLLNGGPISKDQALSGVALRDVEERDDAAEPACECFVVPEEQWTRHYDATEPGSMAEQNPDCPVHPVGRRDDAAGDLP